MQIHQATRWDASAMLIFTATKIPKMQDEDDEYAP
jgi:hypothetical protein